jgi:hypothetical protein
MGVSQVVVRLKQGGGELISRIRHSGGWNKEGVTVP